MSYKFNGRRRSFSSSRHRPARYRGPARSSINKALYVNEATAPVLEVAYEATHDFADFGLNDRVLANVMRRGYTKPTPIQDQAIPVLLSGRDVVGLANTGTGKTAAFLLPLIHKLLAEPDQKVMILAPTQELALQINDELKTFLLDLPLRTCLIIGGTNMNRQIERLKKAPHFVIGTPGRIKDLVGRHKIKPEQFANIVLDEVDRMLDIGFRQDILQLISRLPRQRHAAMFSATMDRATEEIMNKFMTSPVTISVKKQATAANIHQDIVQLRPGENKAEVLYQLLQGREFERVLVFGRTKRGINKLAKQLFAKRVRVSIIHGNKSQSARRQSLESFKQGKIQALLATDVMARGIDVDDITHVINYDEPQTHEDYIHRIGRTGRAGKQGKALTFVG
jgi:superfamily II DNA/RNA helicase